MVQPRPLQTFFPMLALDERVLEVHERAPQFPAERALVGESGDELLLVDHALLDEDVAEPQRHQVFSVPTRTTSIVALRPWTVSNAACPETRVPSTMSHGVRSAAPGFR